MKEKSLLLKGDKLEAYIVPFQEEFRKKFVNFFVLDGFVLDFVNSE